jgi:hypothetical protein
MAEYSRLAQGKVVVQTTGAQIAVALPFPPQYVDIINPARITAGSGVYNAQWQIDMGQGAAVINTAGTTTFITSATGTGISNISAGLGQQYGPTILLNGSGGITQSATTPTITTTAAHGLSVGDVVVFSNLYQTATTGMQQMAGIPFLVLTVGSTTTFTIGWNNNGGNYTAITAGGYQPTAGTYIASFKQVLYPALYAPGQSVVSFVSTANAGLNTTIQTTSPTNVQVGQEIAFHIPTIWGPTQLNSLPNNVIPGSPQYSYVISVTNAYTFVINTPFTGLTAFNPNQPFASFPGQQFPIVAPAGDINSGGYPYAGSALYPSPTVFNGYQGSVTIPITTINGPGIQGSYINATFQGFILGTGVAGTATDTIYYRAYFNDYST